MKQITIDTREIPPSVGSVYDGEVTRRMRLQSLHKFCDWIEEQLPDTDDVEITISGPMSNCIAIQIGLAVSGRGSVVYRSASGMLRRLI